MENAAGHGHAFQNPITVGCPWLHFCGAVTFLGRTKAGRPLQPRAGRLAWHRPPVTRFLTSGTAELVCAASVSCSAVPCHPHWWVPRAVPVCPGSAWGPGSTGGQGLCLQLQLSE